MPEFFSQTEFSMACEYGWRAAPPTLDGVATTNFSHKCYRAAGHAHSLHSCLDLCGPGASPVCPGSELETEFIYTFMSEAGYSRNWLGDSHSQLWFTPPPPALTLLLTQPCRARPRRPTNTRPP